MGEKDFWAILIYRQDLFICQKEVFPLTHTGYQKIINLPLLWMVWHWHWIYDIWRKTIQRTLTKYESGTLVTEWNVTTWYIFSFCPGQLNNTDIDCPLVPWSEWPYLPRLSVGHPWHPSRSALCAVYKGRNALYWPSVINYQLLLPHSVLYRPSTQLHHLVTHSWANWI